MAVDLALLGDLTSGTFLPRSVLTAYSVRIACIAGVRHIEGKAYTAYVFERPLTSWVLFPCI